MNKKKILIIRFSSIGDIVLASPVFRCVKQQLPESEIHFLTKLSFQAVTAYNPHIDRFHYYDNDLDTLLDQLKNEDFDFVVDLHNNIRSHRVVKALKKPSSVIDKLSVKKIILARLKINLMPGRHITQRSLDTVKALGVKDDGGGLDFFIPSHEQVKNDDIPASHQLGYVALVIGANHATKKMPVEKLQDLCRAIKYPIILLGGPSERAEGEQIAAIDPIRIYNSCGKFSLLESSDLLQRSKLVISHDTGLQYIACALNKPVLAIWGGTSPKLDVEPYYGSSLNALQLSGLYENIVLNLWCQPCSKYGGKKCPLGHFKCMRNIDTDMLAAKVHRKLGLL